jgi:PAS domain S-box-containing protein
MGQASARRALGAVACLAMVVVPLSLEGLDYRSFGGYPAVGFAAALLVLAGRRWLWWAVLAETVAVAAAFVNTYDMTALESLVGSLTVTLPSLAAWLVLTRCDRQRFEIDSRPGEQAFYAGTALGAAVCGALGGVLTLSLGSVDEALLTAATAFSSSLAALLAVLPVLVSGSRTAAGTMVERVAQWAVTLVLLALVFLPGVGLPLLFLLPVALSWGANRGSPRSSHHQLLVISVAAYLGTFAGYGPLAVAPDGMPDTARALLLYLLLVGCAYAALPTSVSISRFQAVTAEATQSASTMQRLFESARQTMIITTDAAGIITRVNRGAELLLGYAAEELRGRSPAVLHSAEEVARHAERLGLRPEFEEVALAMALSGERVDWEVLTRSGPRFVSISMTPVTDDDHDLIGFIAVGEDTTERYLAHESLRTALENEHASVARLREVTRVKQELVTNVSHELRTPITSISGYAELLADGALGDLSGDQREVVLRIDRNSRRLIRLVEDLLTLSRLESGGLVLHRAPTDLSAVVREVALLLEEPLRPRSLDLALHVPDVPLVLRADAHELERVLVNLVGNAIKFTPDGGRVDVTLEAGDDEAVITVADTGLGIAADEQEQLFGRFFRASAAIDNAIQGSGLGLSIAHAIVTAHGGTISVASEPGEGTTMTIRLPRDDDEVADEPLLRHGTPRAD